MLEAFFAPSQQVNVLIVAEKSIASNANLFSKRHADFAVDDELPLYSRYFTVWFGRTKITVTFSVHFTLDFHRLHVAD